MSTFTVRDDENSEGFINRRDPQGHPATTAVVAADLASASPQVGAFNNSSTNATPALGAAAAPSASLTKGPILGAAMQHHLGADVGGASTLTSDDFLTLPPLAAAAAAAATAALIHSKNVVNAAEANIGTAEASTTAALSRPFDDIASADSSDNDDVLASAVSVREAAAAPSAAATPAVSADIVPIDASPLRATIAEYAQEAPVNAQEVPEASIIVQRPTATAHFVDPVSVAAPGSPPALSAESSATSIRDRKSVV